METSGFSGSRGYLFNFNEISTAQFGFRSRVNPKQILINPTPLEL